MQIKKVKKIFISIIVTLLSLPSITFAALTATGNGDIIVNNPSGWIGNVGLQLNLQRNCTNLVCHLQNVIGLMEGVVLIIISLSVLVFLWGLIKYVKSIDDKTRQEAIGTITYGIVALFVMVSVWGLVNLLTNSFGFSGDMNNLKNQNINPTNLIRNK